MKKVITVFMFFLFASTSDGQSIIWSKKLPAVYSSVTDWEMDATSHFYLLSNHDSAGITVPSLSKLDDLANPQWNINFYGNVSCNAIRKSTTGTIAIGGAFYDSMMVKGNWFHGGPTGNAFVTVFDSSGTLISSRIINEGGSMSVNDLVFDMHDDMCITGFFHDTVLVDGTSYFSLAPSAYLAKYNGDSLGWFKYSQPYYGGPNYSSGNILAIDDSGNTFVIISGSGNVVFDSLDVYDGGEYGTCATFDNEGTAISLSVLPYMENVYNIISGSSGTFFAAQSNDEKKYMMNGSSSNINGWAWGLVSDAAVSDCNFNYITGSYNDYADDEMEKAIVSKASPHWTTLISASVYAAGERIRTDASCNIFVLGRFAGTLYTPDSIISDPGSSYFIVKMSDNYLLTSEAEDLFLSEASVYPNPSNGLFNIKPNEKTGNAFISVSDLLGNIIFTHKYTDPSEIQINLSAFGKGIYFIEVLSRNDKVIKKIVIN